MRSQYLLNLIILFLVLCISCKNSQKKAGTEAEKDYIFIPEITGNWWQIAGNPDLGECSTEIQEPVDFGIWQAKDGSWQLWSCIRHTACGEHTRLFHGWEGSQLTDTMWTTLGIVMEADTTLGEASGGLQAPYVIREDSIFYMFYGDWGDICLAKSKNGKNFKRIINETGTPALFSGPMNNTRDPMALKIDGKFYCYYTGHLRRQDPLYDTSGIIAAIFCRTSENLEDWSKAVMVSGGGRVADMDSWGGGDAECPFVVAIEDKFVLFRNQLYGPNNLNTEYCSDDPLNFGVNDDEFEVGQLPVAAPEIIRYRDEYYIAALMPDLKGIRIARLRFLKKELPLSSIL